MPERVQSVVAGALAAFFARVPHAAPPETIAWTHGRWFDGRAFVRRDVHAIGDRLVLRKPPAIDRVVDLAGDCVTPAFGEAHNHNIPGVDTNANIRTYLRSTSIPEALEIHRAGRMTPAALLRALSIDAATAILPTRGPYGLATGARADFLVLDAAPIADFSAIQRIRLRVKDGRELRLPTAPMPSR
jgi:imidazolonepropionase-like amidohydrolase